MEEDSGTIFVGIDLGQFRPTLLFTYVLVGLMYVGRALPREWTIPTKDDRGWRI